MNTLKSTSDAIIRKLRATLGGRLLLSSMSGSEAVGDSTVAEVDQLNQGNFQKISDLSAKNSGDTDMLMTDSQNPHIYKCQYTGLDNIVFVRGSGPHKFQYGDQSGQPIKEIIVSRKCAEAVLRGAQVGKDTTLLGTQFCIPSHKSLVLRLAHSWDFLVSDYYLPMFAVFCLLF